MKPQSKIIKALHAQVLSDAEDLTQISRKQEKLRPCYNRFRELERESKGKRERFRRLMTLLYEREGPKDLVSLINRADELGIPTPNRGEKPAVWEAVLEVVRQFPDSQVIDVIGWLASDLRMLVSRQSFDSAVAAHKNLFSTRRQGKGKYISLSHERSLDVGPTNSRD
jgi:hypothetical protein